MSEPVRRKALREAYKRMHPKAGVYRIVNMRTGQALLGSAANLNSVRSKLEFAQSTSAPGMLDHRLSKDIREFGVDAFSLDVLEVLETQPEMTAAEIQADLGALEDLWREKLDPSQLY